jgi:hypothetical protein
MKEKIPEPAQSAVKNPQNLKQNLSDLLRHHLEQEEK